MRRNFALDGFRALAIMMVFSGHTVSSFGATPLLAPIQFGGTGVDLFFVLSGWLIGNQLFTEYAKYGNIDISRFWIRRWMRTMPAYYAVLFVTIAQQYLTKANFSFPWAHLLFVQNYQVDLSLFYVSWSLSVEEQFYLFIAPLALLCLNLSRPFQFGVFLTLLISPFCFRNLELYQTLRETHVRLDCCAMGVFLAYLKHRLPLYWPKVLKLCKAIFPLAVVIYLFFYVARYNPQWGISEPDKLILALVFGCWITWTDTTSFEVTKLWQKLVMFISTRSYAMYLLHVDALVVTKRLLSEHNFVIYYTAAFLITLLLSEILYRLIEIPFINARKYFRFSMSRGKVERQIACQ